MRKELYSSNKLMIVGKVEIFSLINIQYHFLKDLLFKVWPMKFLIKKISQKL
jgi:hypothetical protein